MKKIWVLIISILFLIPFNVFALNKDYEDVTANIVGEKVEENKVNIYLFYSYTCPHCHDEIEYFKELEDKYKDKINIYKYEVMKNKDNLTMMNASKNLFEVTSTGVPFTVIGKEYILGFSETTKDEFTYIIDNYLNDNINNEKETVEKTIPILGKVDAKKTSLTLVGIILGFIDGFNPCAMWILLLLINMTLGMKDKKKMITIGLTFILTSGVIYFLSMLGMSVILDLTMVNIVRDLIAIVAIILGIYNLYVYIKTRKDTGCHVVDKKKRKGIIKKINEIMSKKTTLLAIIGTILLASSVNLIELACSLGFPTIYLELLSLNNIHGLTKIIYLIIYIFFYLIDDLVVFLIAVFTLKSKGISTRYNKFVNLIGGILMILMGILLIFKPDWVMLNF